MTPSLQHWRPLSRKDRSVRRASLRLPAGTSQHRATFLVEEALRLMALPGEDQGRTYYFRRVALRGLAVFAPPAEWAQAAQSAMQALAARAVHGADVRAAGADAVFFESQEEALEWLLRRLFRASPRGADAAEWLAPLIAPPGAGTGAARQVVAAVERLRSLPAGWFAAATVLLEAVGGCPSAFAAIEAIPQRVLRFWMDELGGSPAKRGPAPRMSAGRLRILHGCLAQCGREADSGRPTDDAGNTADPSSSGPDSIDTFVRRELPPHLVWLAALSVVEEDPGELARGSAVAAGRLVLDEMVGPLGRRDGEGNRRPEAPVGFARTEASLAVRASTQTVDPDEAAAHAAEGAGAPSPVAGRALGRSLFTGAGSIGAGLTRAGSTGAGGLYFLLNALRQLGIEAAIEGLPVPLSRTFLPGLIGSLARAASVPHDDAALLWAADAFDAARCGEASECMVSASRCWPRALAAPPDGELTLARLIRVWTLAVRRWCWRTAGLTLRETVLRPGRISLTLTHLDVTLSMDTVDLRVRRAGLDLDPGWLPWFGRVVRFHYVEAPLRCAGGPL